MSKQPNMKVSFITPNSSTRNSANNGVKYDITPNIRFTDVMGTKVVIYFRSQSGSIHISKFTLISIITVSKNWG